jgi:DNA-binding PadR family transcriptional regulator
VGINENGNTSAARQTILKAFAEMKREQLDLHVFFEAAGNDPLDRERILDAVAELQREGIIESRGGDFYALTETGEKQSAAAI